MKTRNMLQALLFIAASSTFYGMYELRINVPLSVEQSLSGAFVATIPFLITMSIIFFVSQSKDLLEERKKVLRNDMNLTDKEVNLFLTSWRLNLHFDQFNTNSVDDRGATLQGILRYNKNKLRAILVIIRSQRDCGISLNDWEDPDIKKFVLENKKYYDLFS